MKTAGARIKYALGYAAKAADAEIIVENAAVARFKAAIEASNAAGRGHAYDDMMLQRTEKRLATARKARGIIQLALSDVDAAYKAPLR